MKSKEMPVAAGESGANHLWRRFSDLVARQGDRIALVDVSSGLQLSYAELARDASTVGSALQNLGVSGGNVVPVLAHRSSRAVAGWLGVLATGAAYLPIDPRYPEAKIRVMLDDCKDAVCLVDEGLDLPAQDLKLVRLSEALESTIDNQGFLPAHGLADDSTACLMFTSGSTGRPKGVRITHAGISRLFDPSHYGDFDGSTKTLQISAPTFDASLFELFGALACGGTCVLYPPENIPQPAELGRIIKTHGVETVFLTTSLFHQFAALAPECFAGLERLFVGGEALAVQHCLNVYAQNAGIRIINGYGPTENTVFTTAYVVPRDLDPAGPMAIGQALPKTGVRLLRDGNDVLDGEIGELFTSGSGVAGGYWNRPEETAERFVEMDGRLYYRTGDLARRDAHGCFFFEGRNDGQLKVRGHRVEPGDLESHLLAHPDVSDARVRIKPDRQREKQLVAYYLAEVPQKGLRSFLAERLPEPIVPAQFIHMDSFPLGPTGKLDEHRLPNPYESEINETNSGPAFGDEAQKLVASVWARFLPAGELGDPDRNFFDAGGTSLQTLELAQHLTKLAGREVSVTRVFEYPTIRQMAAFIGETQQAQQEDAGQRAAAARASRRRRRGRITTS